MSEPRNSDNHGGGDDAGALLRAARERQGLHVAALAAAIKIPPRKLEALEAGRFEELPDATFTRALAMTVCRTLKIDPAPVLAQLPRSGAAAIADVAGGLNQPFRESAGRSDPSESGLLRHPLVWAAILVLAAAASLWILPGDWWRSLLPDGSAPATTSETVAMSPVGEAAPASSAVATEPLPATASDAGPVETAAQTAPAVEVAQPVPAAPDAASSAADKATGLVLLRASKASWIEVVDGTGAVLVRRVLQPGESLSLDGQLPLKLKIGNAAVTQLEFRGQPVDLAPSTRDNIARLQLD